MAQAKTTTDHDAIRQWTEQRGGFPAAVKPTESDEGVGILRIDFPGYAEDDALEHISWETFFRQFEASELAFLHQDQTDAGELSRFCKFVSRD